MGSSPRQGAAAGGGGGFDGADETNAATLPRALGSYLLLQRLGRGGMGTVYLARQSLSGFERFCVVKLVRRRHLGDPVLRARFLDEARTTLLLTHRNICRVLDVGTADGVIYLAMEYVNGRDLRSVLKRCAQVGRVMPPEIAAAILGEVLEALDSAHRLADPSTGKPMELVHRDVSPHNVMVSFEGEVKLIDFGVARSAQQLTQTDPGLVVGKLAYMSPEQAASQHHIDGRSDVFAAGILGYETFVCDRFYPKLSVDEIGQMLDDGSYAPPRYGELPAGIDAILARALTHDVEARPRAGELRKELQAWCVENRKIAGPPDVRAFLEELFPGEETADRLRQQELFHRQSGEGEEVEAETASEGSLRASAHLSEQTVQDRPGSSSAHRRRSAPAATESASALAPAAAPSVSAVVAAPGRSGRRASLAGAVAALLLAAAASVAGVVMVRASRDEPIVIDKGPAASGPLATTTAMAAPTTNGATAATAATAAPVEAAPLEEAPPVAEPHERRASHARHPAGVDAAQEKAEKAEKPEKPEAAALPPRPRLLTQRVRYVRDHCAALPCAAAIEREYGGGVASMNADQAEELKAVVDKCLDACGAP